ncbi:MAG: alpha-mannosidase, partial [Lachnospiraceae bacterium]|nr:alpha-mannosidase [Lachnospiraceae bacterium]
MEKKKTGYVIPHTHWDREWRYPVWENRIYLRDMMEELLDNLEQHTDYKTFLLDGQTVAAQDFLEICPWERERLEALIRAGRIQVGPWYTLPDLYPVSGESIVRNLLKGKAEAEKLGGCLTVGYESFGWGQPSQLPQIYKGFGIDTVIISKNVDKSRAPESEFRWIGADGTEVLATRLGDDARANFFMNAYLEIMTGKAYKTREYEYQYGNDGQFFHQADGDNCVQDYFRLENTERIHRNRIKNAIEKAWNGMRDSWLTDDRAMMDGTDSTTSQPMLQELLAEINAQSG